MLLESNIAKNSVQFVDDMNQTCTSDFAKTGSFSANCLINEWWFLKSSTEGLTSNLLQK
jgi:hypothetical protein